MNTESQKAGPSIWKLGGLTWRELGKRLWVEIYESDLFTRAAALSFYFLLALFPLLLFLTALLGYFADSGTELRENLHSYLGGVVPRSASDLIYTTISEIHKEAGGGKLSFGLIVALLFASSGMGAVSETLNVSYGIRESRPWWKVRLTAVGLTMALATLILSALVLMLYGGEIGEAASNRFGLSQAFIFAWSVFQWPIVLAFMLLAFALIYYFAPDLYHQKWHWVTPGSVVGIGIWMLVSLCFSIYLRYYNTYSLIYGSLGAVIILLLWFYLTGAAILVGGKVNAEIDNAAAQARERGDELHMEKNAHDYHSGRDS
jgi:membrane protein